MTHADRNVDIFGDSWTLANDGREKINRCQTQLWLIEAELKSIGALFQNIGPDASLDNQDLFGVGHALLQLSKRIHRVSERMAHSIHRVSSAEEPAS